MKKTMIKLSTITIVIILTTLCLTAFSKKNTLTLSESFQDDSIHTIQIQSDDWTIKFAESPDDKVHVEAAGRSISKTELPVTVVNTNGSLEITQKKEIRDFISNFTFGTEDRITIMLPSGFTQKITAATNSSDIYLNGISDDFINTETKSGEIL